MRTPRLVALVCSIGFMVGALMLVRPTAGHAQADDAARVMAAARAALGGEGRIAAVRTFVVTGRTRQVRGENLVPIEFEIQAELPDKYSRRDEFPAQDAGPTVTGFNGDRLVQIPPAPPPAARAGGPPAPTPQQLEVAARARMAGVKQDFARLALGLFASSYPSHPLTFTYVGQAEAPQGKADVVDVAGPAGFMSRLFINSQTHLPIMVSWQAQAPPARGRGPAGPGAGAPAGPPPAPVENRMYFAEYRAFDGLQLPTRVRRAVAGETTEETTFDRFRINARVDQRRFDTGN